MAFHQKKSLGQNFLTSDYVPKRMCDAAALPLGSHVVEIGPGTGVLTRELLAREWHVTAVETDPRALEVLQHGFAHEIATEQLTLVAADARTITPADLIADARGYSVIANIPYYLSGLLLRTFLASLQPPTTLVFLMQKELVERIARAEKSSLLSISVAVFGTPIYVQTVKRGHFQPPPAVDSAILKVSDISHHALAPHEQADFFTLLHAGFGQKRKQLQHNLRPYLSRSALTSFLTDNNLAPTARAEDLSAQQWLKLFRYTGTT